MSKSLQGALRGVCTEMVWRVAKFVLALLMVILPALVATPAAAQEATATWAAATSNPSRGREVSITISWTRPTGEASLLAADIRYDPTRFAFASMSGGDCTDDASMALGYGQVTLTAPVEADVSACYDRINLRVLADAPIGSTVVTGGFAGNFPMPLTPFPDLAFIISEAPDSPPVTLQPPSGSALADGYVGAPYSQTITASGGYGAFTYEPIPQYPLPDWLHLDSQTGELWATAAESFDYNVGILATAADGKQAVGIYGIYIQPVAQMSILPATGTTLPAGQVGSAYSGPRITTSGGAGTTTIEISGQPSGLTLSADGYIEGTPTEAGDFAVTVSASRAIVGSATATYSLSIAPRSATVTITPSAPQSHFGDTVSFTASVIGDDPHGTVQFSINTCDFGPPRELGTDGSVALQVSGLAVGSHSIGARYSGDATHAAAIATPIDHDVLPAGTSVQVTVQPAAPLAGRPVTFIATVLPAAPATATPTGTIVFTTPTGISAPVTLNSTGSATITLSGLPVGPHAISAAFTGTGGFATSSTNIVAEIEAVETTVSLVSTPNPARVGETVTFSATVAPDTASGTVVLSIDGVDQAPATLVGGRAEVALPFASAGERSIIARYESDDGIHADATSPALVQVVRVDERTAALISGFLTNRAAIILDNVPGEQRRIDRLNGSAGGGAPTMPELLGYVPALAQGTVPPVATSLAALAALGDAEKPARFDAWIEGTFALFEGEGARGKAGLAAFGADYLVSADLLLGGFLQIDSIAQRATQGAATASGTGWLVGPYATARLADGLYLDLLAGGGTSSNQIQPVPAVAADEVGATRYLLSAALSGDWQWQGWTFSPVLRLSYFEETTEAYADHAGADIPAVTVGQGRLALGPGVSYRLTLENEVVIDTGVRFDLIADFDRDRGFLPPHGRLEARLGIGFAGGAQLGLTASHDGLGGARTRSSAVSATLSAPLD